MIKRCSLPQTVVVFFTQELFFLQVYVFVVGPFREGNSLDIDRPTHLFSDSIRIYFVVISTLDSWRYLKLLSEGCFTLTLAVVSHNVGFQECLCLSIYSVLSFCVL